MILLKDAVFEALDGMDILYKEHFLDIISDLNLKDYFAFIIRNENTCMIRIKNNPFERLEVRKLYTEKLNQILIFLEDQKQAFMQGNFTNGDLSKALEIAIDFSPVINLDPLKLPSIQAAKKLTCTDRNQTALLAHYLRDIGVFYNVNNSSLANVISLLTPHSRHNLRKKGLDSVKHFKKGKDPENEEYNVVESLIYLKGIVDKIGNAIQNDIDNNLN